MAVYPTVAFHFEVQWGGTTVGFSDASGFNFNTEVATYAHGAQPDPSDLKIPGRQTWDAITLKKGVFAGDNELYAWWNTVGIGTIERRDITISLLDESHNAMIVWRIKNAWPSKLTGVSLSASSNEVAVEELELQHEGITQEHVV
jgi:phage tail-like protein